MKKYTNITIYTSIIVWIIDKFPIIMIENQNDRILKDEWLDKLQAAIIRLPDGQLNKIVFGSTPIEKIIFKNHKYVTGYPRVLFSIKLCIF